jgi:hypothetical protein
VIGKLAAQLIEQHIDREINDLAADDAGLELVDVEKGVQHPRHRTDRLTEPVGECEDCGIGDLLRQDPL